MIARRKLAQFVELAIIGQIALGDQTENVPVVDDCRAVEKHVVDSERKTNHGDRGDIARGLDNLVQGIAAGIE